jgi:hypothetical protein
MGRQRKISEPTSKLRHRKPLTALKANSLRRNLSSVRWLPAYWMSGLSSTIRIPFEPSLSCSDWPTRWLPTPFGGPHQRHTRSQSSALLALALGSRLASALVPTGHSHIEGSTHVVLSAKSGQLTAVSNAAGPPPRRNRLSPVRPFQPPSREHELPVCPDPPQ